ncbi:hypothetical protein [Mesoplasma photuris]|uniref:hypothetical protein n=1 Tax=Mesoplasma photuris TaxID=217731 RepID=UPI0004E263D1|nr:hypothetical protein [Mesoplasma photuris]
MEPIKVYEQIVIALNNVFKHDKLRYKLSTDSKWRKLVLKQVNNLLALELNNNTTFNELQWAKSFGKALLKVTKSTNLRIEKSVKLVDEIENDYNDLLTFAVKEYRVTKTKLTNVSEFTFETLKANSVLTDEVIKIQKENEAKETAEKTKTENPSDQNMNAESQKVDAENIKVNQNQQTNFNQQNPFMGGPNMGGMGQGIDPTMFQNMPIHPMQDIRYYPFDRKPKWMPIMKKVLAILTVLASIFLVAGLVYVNTAKIDMHDGIIDAITSGTNNTWILSDEGEKLSDNQLKLFNNISISAQIGFMNWFSMFFYILPTLYICGGAFRQHKSDRTRYRTGIMSIMFMIMFFGMSIFTISGFVNLDGFENSWGKLFKTLDYYFILDGKPSDLWNAVMQQDGVSTMFNTASILMIVAIVFISLSIVIGVMLIIANPKPDREKNARANLEYQKATASFLQGGKYEMDPTLFQDDVEIKEKSKFSLWIEKTFKNGKKGSE